MGKEELRDFGNYMVSAITDGMIKLIMVENDIDFEAAECAYFSEAHEFYTDVNDLDIFYRMVEAHGEYGDHSLAPEYPEEKNLLMKAYFWITTK